MTVAGLRVRLQEGTNECDVAWKAEGVQHGNKNRAPANALTAEERQQVITSLGTCSSGACPTRLRIGR